MVGLGDRFGSAHRDPKLDLHFMTSRHHPRHRSARLTDEEVRRLHPDALAAVLAPLLSARDETVDYISTRNRTRRHRILGFAWEDAAASTHQRPAEGGDEREHDVVQEMRSIPLWALSRIVPCWYPRKEDADGGVVGGTTNTTSSIPTKRLQIIYTNMSLVGVRYTVTPRDW